MKFFSDPIELPPVPLNQGFYYGADKIKVNLQYEVDEVMNDIHNKRLNGGVCSVKGCGYIVNWYGLAKLKDLRNYVSFCVENDLKVEYRCCAHVGKLTGMRRRLYGLGADYYRTGYDHDPQTCGICMRVQALNASRRDIHGRT